MDDLRNDINNKLELLEQLISNNDVNEIENIRKELDKLLDKYMEDFD